MVKIEYYTVHQPVFDYLKDKIKLVKGYCFTVKHPDFDKLLEFGVKKTGNKNWTVTELSTGKNVMEGITRKDAIGKTTNKILNISQQTLLKAGVKPGERKIKE